MINKTVVFILLIILSTNTFGGDKTQCILRIDNQFITKDEFLYVYKKNNTGLAEGAEKMTPAAYMELFINFRLKVMEAQRQGLDTLASFRNELKKYRKESAQQYLTCTDFDEQTLRDAYYRTKYERKASHILIDIPSPTDTLDSWNRINELRKKIMDGADFNKIAFLYSDDPSAEQNKGELGYFCGGMMDILFENAAYKTPVGEISEPVRTKFGYHLIRVEDERESKGQMSVAHIMKRFPRPGNGYDIHSNERLESEMDSLHRLLENGADFGELAKKYSDDKNSAKNGGILLPFTEGKMIPSFAQAAFALQNDGDISPVIETPYGWHIIKRLKHISVPAFDEIKDQLAENLRKNPQIRRQRWSLFIQQLKKEYNFSMNEEVKEQLLQNVSLNYRTKKISAKEGLDTTQVLFSFYNTPFTVDDYIRFQNANGEITRQEEIPAKIEEMVGNKLFELENSRLEEKYPEFRMLMQEYHDGVLLFNISEKQIWNKASEDTLGLKDFYEKNKNKYMDGGSFKGWVISCKNIETRHLIDDALNTAGIGKKELLTIVNANYPGAANIVDGVFRKGDNPVVDYYVWKSAKPEGMNDLLTFVRGDKLPPAPKSFEETKGICISDYQNFLDQEWIKKLRSEHHIKINKKLLRSIPSLK